jgi:hypothetical protein
MLFLTCAQRKKEKYVSIFYLLVPSLENVGIFSSTNMGNPFLINMHMWPDWCSPIASQQQQPTARGFLCAFVRLALTGKLSCV